MASGPINGDPVTSGDIPRLSDQSNQSPNLATEQQHPIRTNNTQSHSIRLTATIRTQPASQQQQHPTNNNNGEFPQQTQNLFQMRDRLFLALFFRASLIYARAVPKFVRRILEFLLLMQSFILLLTLAYIHVVYTQTPITCLEAYKNSWPKDGILRVEITSEPSAGYNIAKSYEKEERLRQRNAQAQMGQYSNDDLLSLMLTADSMILDKAVSTAGAFLSSFTSGKATEGENSEVSDEPDANSENEESAIPVPLKPSESSSSSVDNSFVEEDTEELIDDHGTDEEDSTTNVSKHGDSSDMNEMEGDGVLAPGVGEAAEDVGAVVQDENIAGDGTISPSVVQTASGEGTAEHFNRLDIYDPDSPYFNMTKEEIELLRHDEKQKEEETILKSKVSDLEMFSNSVWLQDHAYIVEYSLEYGFLRLTPQTRQRLNITVKIVTLDPSEHTCFGNNLSRFLLDHFLGYDDILMSSIKNLAETEESRGYLRNVVTGEQFRFVPMWMARSAYLPALLIMLVFTVSISMLLRYSHHQIFVFIVDLLNNVEGNGAIHVPAAPLFTVILALVGMEAIMSEFFNDTSIAFYVILIVWIADQYDSVCCHTNMTRTYWVRFFYLYHFVFYAYHYRFNGQYGGLALLTSWSFVQHSMVYFYHHYELPTILRQAHLGEEQFRNLPRTNPAPADSNPPPAPPSTGGGGSNTITNNPGEGRSSGPLPPTLPERSLRPSPSSATGETEPSPEETSRYNITTLSAELTFTSRRNPEPEPRSTEPSLPPHGGENETSRTGRGANFLTAPNVSSYGLRLRSLPSTSHQSPGSSLMSQEPSMSPPLESIGTLASSAAEDELD